MKTNKGGITKYCTNHNIKVIDLAELVEVTHGQLYLFNKDPMYPAKISTLQKIYDRTKKRFKIGLKPQDFLDFPILIKK